MQIIDEEDDMKEMVIAGKKVGSGNTILKLNNEFYKEECHVPHNLIQVKKAKKSNDWNILENGKVKLALPGNKFTGVEREFFKTSDGIRFLLAAYKEGNDTVLKIKKAFKCLNQKI